MKKIFTLIAMAAMAIGANAQTWNFSDEKFSALGEISETVTIDGLTIAATADKKVTIDENNKSIDDFSFTSRMKMGGSGSADYRNLSFTVGANSTVTVYGMSANKDATDRNLVIASGSFDNKVYDAPLLGDQIYKVEQTIAEAGTVYVYSGNSGLNFYAIVVSGGQQGGNEGQGGQQPSGDVEKYVAAPDGALAAEFAAVVDGENATNVVDGKSVVTITTANVTVEAVGGATPANVDGGAQDITPGSVVDAETHRYEVASVGTWNNVTWKNGNNKTDINDEAGTKLYFVIGSGNPYVKMYAEEIYTDDAPTGRYRAAYDYYKPGMDMPQVGLYYKFTTKVDGKMKVQVWANKGNRNTYLINGQTKEAVAYQATGYVNGQKVVNENNEKVLNAEGQEMMRLFTPEEIQERHNAKKVGEDGVDTAPYVIDEGGQAFWGWIIFDAKAGVDYWLFQDSSQVGFGGFEFTTGDGTGVREIIAVKNDANAPVYNLAGQRVSPNTKGILIKNGKKFINK